MLGALTYSLYFFPNVHGIANAIAFLLINKPCQRKITELFKKREAAVANLPLNTQGNKTSSSVKKNSNEKTSGQPQNEDLPTTSRESSKTNGGAINQTASPRTTSSTKRSQKRGHIKSKISPNIELTKSSEMQESSKMNAPGNKNPANIQSSVAIKLSLPLEQSLEPPMQDQQNKNRPSSSKYGQLRDHTFQQSAPNLPRRNTLFVGLNKSSFN